MAVTYSLTVQGRFRSRLDGALFCVATAAAEVVTLVHRLGASLTKAPDVSVRSLVSGISGAPVFSFSSWNASQVVAGFTTAPNLGACAVTADIMCEVTWRAIQ